MLASFAPLPFSPRGGLVHTVCACAKFSLYIFRKKLRALPCPYAKDYTRLKRRFNLQNPAGILLAWQCHFPKRTVQQKVRFTKKARQWYPQNTYVPSYTVCSASTLNTIGLYNRTGARYRLSKQRITITNPLKTGILRACANSVYQASPLGGSRWGEVGGGGAAAGNEAILGYADRTTYYRIPVNLCFPIQVEI